MACKYYTIQNMIQIKRNPQSTNFKVVLRYSGLYNNVFLFSFAQNPSINHLNFYCIKIFPCVCTV